MFVRLCDDVLIDVLRYGTRRQLAILESMGRRTYKFVGHTFAEIPYLHLPHTVYCITGKVFSD